MKDEGRGSWFLYWTFPIESIRFEQPLSDFEATTFGYLAFYMNACGNANVVVVVTGGKGTFWCCPGGAYVMLCYGFPF